MNTLLTNYRFSPSLFEDFRKEMSRLTEGFFDDRPAEGWFAPAANIAETETSYEVSVDLPGMKPENVEVEFKDGHLWITGERMDETEEKGKTFHRVERRYGKFRRVIALGTEVDPEGVEANYKDGVLTVHVPKIAAVQPKRIPVKA